MKHILILGAGLSSTSLIDYLLSHSIEYDWKVKVGDYQEDVAIKKVNGHERGEGFHFDIFNEEQKEKEIKWADLVISMLPASFHVHVAKACLKLKKNMLTASYVADDIKKMEKEIKESGLLFLNEMGVDPGIDHMSAMEIIHRIKEQGGKLISFKSSTGGLPAPKSDNNPWNYKFTWNPRNVVVAGQGISKYISDGRYKYIPYHKLFQRLQRTNVLNYGEFEIYANRDSLKYRELYDLKDIPTMFRGTMRRPGFCKSWDALVQLGMTDDTYTLENSENMTYCQFTNTFLKYERDAKDFEGKVAKYLNIDEDSSILYKLRWLGLFSDEKVGLKNATPAQVVQDILVKKWVFEKDDKDIIAMQHQFEYELNGEMKYLTSSLVVEGKDFEHTAMSETVGIPVAIAAKLILTEKIKEIGVHVPVKKEIYKPILQELKAYGIEFIEE